MAKEMETKKIVAVKKIRMDNERDDFPITAIREIKILKKLHHQNIVNLEKVVTSPEAIHAKDIEQSNLQEKKSELSYAFEWMIYPQGTSKHTRHKLNAQGCICRQPLN